MIGVIAAAALVLRYALGAALRQVTDAGGKQFAALCGALCFQLRVRYAVRNRNYFLRQDVPAVKGLLHKMNGHARVVGSLTECPEEGNGAAIDGQEGRVNVEAAEARQGENGAGNTLRKAGHTDDIRLICRQSLQRFRSREVIDLPDGKLPLAGKLQNIHMQGRMHDREQRPDRAKRFVPEDSRTRVGERRQHNGAHIDTACQQGMERWRRKAALHTKENYARRAMA